MTQTPHRDKADREKTPLVQVLFVCMGNICRSPSAEALFRYHVETGGFRDFVRVASAGTHSYHVGSPADPRSHQAAINRGVDMTEHRAQQFKKEHFDQYNYILVMDEQNHRHVMGMCPPNMSEKVHYFLDFAPQLNTRIVPDPYHGGTEGFDHVLDLIEAASAGLLADIRERHVDPANAHPEINA
jgi:protein-tyrosine phosphatase